MAIRNLKTTRDFARIWFYWKVPAILVFCFIVIGICLYSFTQTPMYETKSKLLLLPKTNDELVVNAGQGRSQYDVKRVDLADITTEIELIKSNAVLSRTIAYFEEKSPKLFPDENENSVSSIDKEKKVIQLVESMTIEPILNSNMISISLLSPNQEKVADILNKLVEIYIDFHKKMYSTEEGEAFYDDQKNYYGKKLKAARIALKEFNGRNDITNMVGQIDANIGLISTFNEQLQNLEVEIAENEVKIKMLEKGVKIHGNKIILSREMRNMPVIIELTKGLVPLLIKRTEISKTFTKQSREFKQIDDQIAMLRNEIRNESIGAAYTNNIEMESLKTKRVELAKRIQYLRDRNKLIDQKQQELSALELDAGIAKKNYLLYGTKTEDSRMYAKRNETKISNVVVAEPAVMPIEAKSPKKMIAFQIALFLGFFAALILPFFLETMDHKLKTIDDIEGVLSVPVVCSYGEV